MNVHTLSSLSGQDDGIKKNKKCQVKLKTEKKKENGGRYKGTLEISLKEKKENAMIDGAKKTHEQWKIKSK